MDDVSVERLGLNCRTLKQDLFDYSFQALQFGSRRESIDFYIEMNWSVLVQRE